MNITPGQTVTFTVKETPKRSAHQKTIRRLMRMQPHIQRGLAKLARRRRQKDNNVHQRGGRMWTQRVTTTKLTHVLPGETFTITVTPQIMPDLRSVESFLDATAS